MTVQLESAFPVQYDDGSCQGGMTLRDYFAAAALQGILAQYESSCPQNIKACAKDAYLFADEMLKVRESPQEGEA
jgi:hypothetical protein